MAHSLVKELASLVQEMEVEVEVVEVVEVVELGAEQGPGEIHN